MPRSVLYLAVAVGFALHNAEEAWFAPRVIEFFRSHGPVVLQGLFTSVEAGPLRVVLLALSAGGVVLSLVAGRSRAAVGWTYAILVLASVVGLNAVSHIGFSLAYGLYVPGLVTAVTVTLPVALLLLRRAWRERWVGRLAFWSLLPVSLVVQAPVLAALLWLASGWGSTTPPETGRTHFGNRPARSASSAGHQLPHQRRLPPIRRHGTICGCSGACSSGWSTACVAGED